MHFSIFIDAGDINKCKDCHTDCNTCVGQNNNDCLICESNPAIKYK